MTNSFQSGSTLRIDFPFFISCNIARLCGLTTVSSKPLCQLSRHGESSDDARQIFRHGDSSDADKVNCCAAL